MTGRAQPSRPASRRGRRRSTLGAAGAPPVAKVAPNRAGRRPPPPPSRFSNPWYVLGAVAVGLLVVAGVWVLLGPGATASPAAARGHDCPVAQPASLDAGQTRTVTIKTSLGDIVIKVDGNLAPIAAGNFVALASCGFYDGTVFHRTATLPDGTPYVIQGGDPLGDGSGGPGYTIADETVTTEYKRGTVAMARAQQPHSQGSQFFIVLSDEAAAALQDANNYAIFGTVVSGMEVADAIYAASGGQELPPHPIQMTAVTVSTP